MSRKSYFINLLKSDNKAVDLKSHVMCINQDNEVEGIFRNNPNDFTWDACYR